jgi:hypothetical protein
MHTSARRNTVSKVSGYVAVTLSPNATTVKIVRQRGQVRLAMLIGQQLNTCGDIQTYKHISTDGVGNAAKFVRILPALSSACFAAVTSVSNFVKKDCAPFG